MLVVVDNNSNNIFPLSPDPSLKGQGDVSAYFIFLKDALKNKRIHNIAVTGGFGTGKSSLLRSFDQMLCEEDQKEQRNGCPVIKILQSFFSVIRNVLGSIINCFGKKKADNEADNACLSRFMYVSVGDYSAKRENKPVEDQENKPVDNQEKKPGHKQKEKPGEDITSIRAIERRLLLQLFARFRRADLPQSNFRLIPEAWTKQNWLIAILVGFFVFSALILVMHEQFGALFAAVNSMKGLPKWGTRITAFLVKHKTLLRLLLSEYCIVFCGVASVFLCVRVLPRIRFHELTVKGANAELSVERDAVESYLDLYSMELVYCLEKIADKVGHVVVFEDLDRLDSGDCLYILTRLREINNLVNLRLQKKSETLRFIYAVNDEILEDVQHEKFFDYTLPVIPQMNKRSAAVLFGNKIKQIDDQYVVSVVFPQFDIVASCLSDFRLQNTILNEYQVLLELYTESKKTKPEDEAPELTYQQKNEILALVIYKNCWPGDYHALRENNSQIFTTEGVKCPDTFRCTKYWNILRVLTDPDNPLLTPHSLYYVNFSEKTLADMCFKHWKEAIKDSAKHKGIIAELNAIQEDDLECISKVREVFKSPSIFVTDCDDKSQKYNVDLFRAVLSCLVRCKERDNNWFFNVDYYNVCIRLLAGLKDKDDEALKSEFFKLSHEKIMNKSNFYGASETAISGFGEYTEDEIRELCRGVKQIPYGVIIWKDLPKKSNEKVNEIQEELSKTKSTCYFD